MVHAELGHLSNPAVATACMAWSKWQLCSREAGRRQAPSSHHLLCGRIYSPLPGTPGIVSKAFCQARRAAGLSLPPGLLLLPPSCCSGASQLAHGVRSLPACSWGWGQGWRCMVSRRQVLPGLPSATAGTGSLSLPTWLPTRPFPSLSCSCPESAYVVTQPPALPLSLLGPHRQTLRHSEGKERVAGCGQSQGSWGQTWHTSGGLGVGAGLIWEGWCPKMHPCGYGPVRNDFLDPAIF